MRKTYKFSHSIFRGGHLYSHKCVGGEEIENKTGLRESLNSVARKFCLIDVTIRIYDNIFFFFFMMKPTVIPLELIKEMQRAIHDSGSWYEDYIHMWVYDLQEEYVRKYLKGPGFEYDNG